MTTDPFFSLLLNSEWNALIGRQGSSINYADGYIEAALDLANLMIKEDRFWQRDTLVLPILYNARHSIELHLKLIIEVFVDGGIVKTRHTQNHDIASHLKFLRDCNVYDLSLRHLLQDLQPFVESLARIDDDGQELRYSTNRDGKMSLDDRALANIVVIRDSLVTLKDILERTKYRAFELCEEHSTGTHTDCLSRADLFQVARMLPKRHLWRENRFDECKAAIMEHFAIGSRQFSAALDKVQEQRQLKAIIGVSTDLVHLGDENALFLAQQWRVFHPPRQSPAIGIDFFRRDISEIAERRRIETNALDCILARLSSDEIADAETIYYLARDRNFTESYESNLERKKKEYRASGDLEMETFNLMHKTNFLLEFRRGAAMLGRLELENHLKEI
ncbi:hypothetical protein [Agrobacterium tumefaciens]|uniref:hypothetical protein n=1 Tax=Agrobacterium tumefaciens TaxID=358 RepID=UPI0021FD87E0|nr:hypothetical protein FY128_17045 [Agrobacterium tumefaciens]